MYGASHRWSHTWESVVREGGESLDTVGLFKTTGEARRKTEVNVHRFDKGSIQLFHNAKSDDIDQWSSNRVVSTCVRAGIRSERIMSIDPDLATVRSEAPTISRLGR